MSERVVVEFEVTDRVKFLEALQKWDEASDALEKNWNYCLGFRADDQVAKREALIKFTDAMEVKLRKNEHKRTWREKPIAALFQLMLLEIKELEVAMEFFDVREARTEAPDIGNYAMMLYDRMGMLDQDKPLKEQQ